MHVIYTLPKELPPSWGPSSKIPTDFTIGSFKFLFRFRGAFERYADFSAYDISYESLTLKYNGPFKHVTKLICAQQM